MEIALLLKSFALDKYDELVARSTVLERDRHGVKVLATPEGLIVKLFRQKRLISSARLRPYASRFVNNAKALEKLDIKTIKVLDVLYCTPIKRTLVFYQPVPGRTLRDVLKSQTHTDDIMKKFIVFLAELHDKGVFFRSIHLSNVIVSDDSDKFGLIDFADMKIASKALSRDVRLRNFKHLARYRVDQDSIKNFGLERFMDVYFEASILPRTYKDEFLKKMQELINTEGTH